ncbi:unnamed protein product [Owenia fusiformis]|uniref:Lipase maturation factor n=1 Tax=Owenia fusiformis TaxID=6347 RepID=A0A8J1TZA8_OWEFU|nr:unnamed protein product [Owenia fusiformis]
MASIGMTRDLFLWWMSGIYLCAFASLYIQIPGLYGDNGILPAKLVVRDKAKDVNDFFKGSPTLLSLTPYLGLTTQQGMEFLTFGGILVSFLMFISKPQRSCAGFFLLWALYFSVYQVGQTFLWFQWDILLLEAGFLTALLAPINIKLFRWSVIGYNQHDHVTLWLVKWLLFRLMFASGVVKLTSHCPTWWGLTALTYHYETQCIPTPAAWYLHQLPEWFQKFSVVATYVIEIPIPFLFFAPVRALRLFSFYSQVLLQVMIILTGNYNFFNLLTIALCISLLDDKHIGYSYYSGKQGLDAVPILGAITRRLRLILGLAAIGGLAYGTQYYFSLELKNDYTLGSKVNFTKGEFRTFMEKSVPIAMYMGAVSLAWEILCALGRSVTQEKGLFNRLWATSGTVVFSCAAAAMFSISLVTLTVLDKGSEEMLPPVVYQLHERTHKFHLTSSYGLFRRMTGVGGRPEVILEGSNSEEGPWREYYFHYKPGNVYSRPPIVAPHQPRLDWQMWFAALGTTQHNPWFVNLVYRLLTNQREVVSLLQTNPFPHHPPKFIKAHLHHYHFTSTDEDSPRYSRTAWWKREKQDEYLPIVSKTNPLLQQHLKHFKIIENKSKEQSSTSLLTKILKYLRNLTANINHAMFVWTVIMTGLVLAFFDLYI